MSQPVIIIGAGGHGRVVADVLHTAGHVVHGFVDADTTLHGQTINGLDVLGGDHYLDPAEPSDVLLANGIGANGKAKTRFKIFQDFKARGFTFVNAIHPFSAIGSDVFLGEGVQIMPGVVVNTGSRINANVIINTRASVDHDCMLAEHVHIAPGVTLSGDVTVGTGSHIGTGACVIQGITIGNHCLIGAGAVVRHDVADGKFVAGVPAREVAT